VPGQPAQPSPGHGLCQGELLKPVPSVEAAEPDDHLRQAQPGAPEERHDPPQGEAPWSGTYVSVFVRALLAGANARVTCVAVRKRARDGSSGGGPGF
jgi:hypothetical protein